MALPANTPVSDPRWREIAHPFEEFLKEPRTWADLHAFAKTLKMGVPFLVNVIAWLEDQHLVRSENIGKVVYWLGPGVILYRRDADASGIDSKEDP